MDLTLTQLCDIIQSGKATPLEVMKCCFDRLERLQPKLNCFTVLCKEKALHEAEEQTRTLEEGGKIGPLCGVPLAVKDLEDVKGLYSSLIYM